MSKRRPRKRDESAKMRKPRSGPSGASNWLWGQHAVAAALSNPNRSFKRVFATKNAAERATLKTGTFVPVSPGDLSGMLPQQAVHQGLAAEVEPLVPAHLEDVLQSDVTRLVVVDQISDPHNLGAIFRSAAAFGFSALIIQDRNTPPITGIVAKSAAGAIETVSECRVVNISRALEQIAQAGFHSVGLTGDAPSLLDNAVQGANRLAVVLGAEGSGLRPGVSKACAQLARIPIDGSMESLNVSNAAAIAFYEASRALHGSR